jgi:endo-1,4-beta-xylanase
VFGNLLISPVFSGNIFAQSNTVLKDVFKNYFRIGAALNYFQYTEKDTLSVKIVKKQFNTITPENDLKWERIHPKPDSFNFAPADRYVEFGEKNDMFIIGHTLVWHAQTPQWVFQDTAVSKETGKKLPADRAALLQRMKNHISTVVGRYKGRIKGWDVVNEALNEDGTLRQSQWMKIIGDDFIEKAFEFAHEADPNAELYYNDYSLDNKPKRDGAVRLIKSLLSKGIKITGVGLQGHYKMDWPSAAQFDSTIKAFSALGIKVMITELDIDVLPQVTQNNTADISLKAKLKEKQNPYKDGLPDSVQNALAARYADLFAVLLKNSNSVSRVTFWGVTDKESWLNNWPVFGRTSYPLLFDRNGSPKAAFNAIIKEVVNKSSK